MIRLRAAGPDDARYVWTLNNHPSVRAQSIHTGEIPWETHVKWYEDRLRRAGSRLFVALDGQTPVGVVRWDIADGEAVISIAVDAAHRGRGVGKRAIAIATGQALTQPGVRVAVALIRPDNIASQRAFVDNQFIQTGTVEVAATTMLRFEKRPLTS